MKKQRVRPQDQPLLYDSHVLNQINTLTHSHYYKRYTWRQDLHLLNPPIVPPHVEKVFLRNEENKKATEKMKLLRMILADKMKINVKEGGGNQMEMMENCEKRKRKERLQEEEIDELLMKATRFRGEPKKKTLRLAAKSRVPLHLMTSATLAPLPLERPGTAPPRSSEFLRHASDPRFQDLLTLVQTKNPESALLGGKSHNGHSRYVE